jgi:hypothetical protein
MVGETLLKGLGADDLKKNILYLVFNKEQADCVRGKCPANVTVSTANALGFRSILKTKNKMALVYPCLSNDIYTGIFKDYREYKDMDPELQLDFLKTVNSTLNNYLNSLEIEITVGHVTCDSTEKEKQLIIKFSKIYWDLASVLKCNISHDVYMKLFSLKEPNLAYDIIAYDQQNITPVMMDIINKQNCRLVS